MDMDCSVQTPSLGEYIHQGDLALPPPGPGWWGDVFEEWVGTGLQPIKELDVPPAYELGH